MKLLKNYTGFGGDNDMQRVDPLHLYETEETIPSWSKSGGTGQLKSGIENLFS